MACKGSTRIIHKQLNVNFVSANTIYAWGFLKSRKKKQEYGEFNVLNRHKFIPFMHFSCLQPCIKTLFVTLLAMLCFSFLISCKTVTVSAYI